MPLVNCPACSGEVSERAQICPHCGEPRSSGRSALQRRRVAHVVGKTIVILVLGTLTGYGMNYEDRQNAARAATLTFEQYASDFEQYKDDLVAEVVPPVENFLGALLFIGIAFGLYEAAGAGLARLIRRIFFRNETRGDLSLPGERG